MISFKKYESAPELREACSLALRHRLFVNGWFLREDLWDIRQDPHFYVGRSQIVLAFNCGEPIGIILSDAGVTSAFVRKSFRRQGVAGNAIKFGNIEITKFGEGIRGSLDFWLKMRNTTGEWK